MQMRANRLTKTVLLSSGETLTILEDISFIIDSGEIFGITGVSGSGKSSLLGLLSGLDLPSSGSIYWDNTEINQLNEDERAKLRLNQAGFVFQNFELLETYTALENVMLPLELAGRKESNSESIALLTDVGLKARLHHYPNQLSGGEQQRVALARAFVGQPKVLFLDEPTGSLDQQTAAMIIQTIVKLNQLHQTTLICVTHDPNLNPIFTQSIKLSGGKIESQ